MNSRELYVKINNQVLIKGYTYKMKDYNWGTNSLAGINFFNRFYRSEFKIDDFCVTDVQVQDEAGTKVEFLSHYTQTLDLR